MSMYCWSPLLDTLNWSRLVMPPINSWQVDAFTDRPIAGNSAAVCWLERYASGGLMQAVAAEMNLSETAFVRRLCDGYIR